MFSWQRFDNKDQHLEVYALASPYMSVDVAHNTRNYRTDLNITYTINNVEIHHHERTTMINPTNYAEKTVIRFMLELQKTISDDLQGLL